MPLVSPYIFVFPLRSFVRMLRQNVLSPRMFHISSLIFEIILVILDHFIYHITFDIEGFGGAEINISSWAAHIVAPKKHIS